MTIKKQFDRIKKYINVYGYTGALYKICNKAKNKNMDYNKYTCKNENNSLNVTNLSRRPIISFIIPVKKEYIKTVNSLVKQTYNNYEIILVSDHSIGLDISMYSKTYLKVTDSGYTTVDLVNEGLKIASGEFIAFVLNNSVVAPDAVYEITKAVNTEPKADIIYTDEDKVVDGIFSEPYYKPDWSPDTAMSFMYTGNLTVYRKNLIDKISYYKYAWQYDLFLKAVEKSKKIVHISKVLYHKNTDTRFNEQEYLSENKKIKEKALLRRGLSGEVVNVNDIGETNIIYNVRFDTFLSIIIPSKDNFKVLERCILSVIENTININYEIIVVDNGSSEENKILYENLCKKFKIIYVYKKQSFNFSVMCNLGAKSSKGDYLLFLNDDTEIKDNEWIRKLVGHSSLSYVGAVGAKLYYPNSDFIQHAGIINTYNGPSYAFSCISDSEAVYAFRNRLSYNYLSLTAACLCVSRDKFFDADGFDEKLAVAYNDIDLCLKLYEKGYYNVLRNDITIYHYESLSRGLDTVDENKKQRLDEERDYLYKKHKMLYFTDPFYNKNLLPDKPSFQIDYNKTDSVFVGVDKIVNYCENSNIIYSVDAVEIINDKLNIAGYIFNKNILFNNINKKLIGLVDKDNNVYLYTCNSIIRPDMTGKKIKGCSISLSSFVANIEINGLKEGKYKLAFILTIPLSFKKYIACTDEYIEL